MKPKKTKKEKSKCGACYYGVSGECDGNAKCHKKQPTENPVAMLSVELGGMTEIEKTAFCVWLIKQARFIDERPTHVFAQTYRARMFRR